MTNGSPELPMTVGSGAAQCYRHAGRETRVRCARCERPICPDCMRDAPVGFQCPECVRAGRVTTRTPTGARLVARQPVVTYVLIALNVLAFIGEQTSPSVVGDYSQYNAAVAYGHQYYRLITAVFLHENVLHIAMNMYALYLLGPVMERALGWWRYLGLYLVCGLAGSTLAYAAAGLQVESLGASGAIFGLFSGLWLVSRRAGAPTSQITGLIAINLVITFLFPHISWQGHLGGLAAGAVITAGFLAAPRIRPRWALHAALLAAVAAVSFAVVLWHTASVT